MSRFSYSRKHHSRKVTLHEDVAVLGEPTLATDGGSLASWKSVDGFAARDATLAIDKGATASGDATLAAGAVVVGYDATDGKWRAVGKVAEGEAVVCTDNVGHEQRLFDVGVFEGLAVVGAPDDKLTITVKPIEDVTR